MDWERCLEILVEYGVGPQTEQILHTHWEGLTMVSRAGRYYGNPSAGSRGVTQSELISLTILNMVVDVVIRHWEMVVAGEDAVPEGFCREVQKLASLFYVDESLLASPHPDRLQEALNILPGLFYRIVLLTNMDKTVGMVCQPFRN